MSENSTTALVKTPQSPALSRVSNQLALTDKLLIKPEEPFLIPYRKGNKWFFCDRNKNIVIDCVYKYPNFYKENIRNIWYVHNRANDWQWGDWENKGFVRDDLITNQAYSTDCDTYVVLKVNPKKNTLLLVSTSDAIMRKLIIDGKKIIITGSRVGANLYWMRAPATTIYNIGDKIETKVDAEFVNEIERD